MAQITRLEKIALVLLIGSGCLHLLLWPWGTELWDAPASLRKPALFGISTGLTLWSCLWIFSQFPCTAWTAFLRALLTGSLTLEVALITLQAWRGEASHFNRQTPLDATIESTLLLLISGATLIIFWLTVACFRTGQLSLLPRHFRLAVKAGLVLLSLSCLIGFVITILGNQAIAAGRLPETYPPRGVLKFPHGAALHAIQILVILAWLATRLKARWPEAIVWSALTSQGLGLLFAASQTFQGRARFELDRPGALLLLSAVSTMLVSLGLLAWPQTRPHTQRTTKVPTKAPTEAATATGPASTPQYCEKRSSS